MAVVMISHRSSDSDLAEKLAEELAAAHHDVRLDTWDLLTADSITGWMNSNLGDAKYLVVCYSLAGAESPWMSREWLSTLARQLNGEGVKLVPARFHGGTPPPILADLKYADLASDWSRGVTELLRVIR